VYHDAPKYPWETIWAQPTAFTPAAGRGGRGSLQGRPQVVPGGVDGLELALEHPQGIPAIAAAHRLNHPDRSGQRRVRIHAIGFPTIFSQARFGENTGVRFAMLMRLLCEQNGGAFVALNSLKP